MNRFASPLVAILAFVSAAAAAPSVAPTTTTTTTATGVPAAKAPYWLKAYSTAPIQESWSAVLTVKNLDADLPRVLKAIAAAGGALTQAQGAFVSSKTNHTQQLVLMVPRERAQGLLKAWRRLGDLPAPETVSPGVAIPADEVRAKIDRLMKERVDRAADLAKLPVALEIEDEVLEHLLLVEEVARNGSVAVRVDLLLRQR